MVSAVVFLLVTKKDGRITAAYLTDATGSVSAKALLLKSALAIPVWMPTPLPDFGMAANGPCANPWLHTHV